MINFDFTFIISNKSLLKVSERHLGFDGEFFLMNLSNKYHMLKVLSNIAHEKLLLTLYLKNEIIETTTHFSTFFDDTKKFTIYRDYANNKTYSIKHTSKLLPEKLYPIDLIYEKKNKEVLYQISINHDEKLVYTAKLGKAIKIEKTKVSSKKNTEAEATKDFKKEVIEIIKAAIKTKMATNKFANISLGRINKIPILINLSSKYKNVDVKLTFKKEKLLDIFDSKKMLIKSFNLANNPKSNWLERK